MSTSTHWTEQIHIPFEHFPAWCLEASEDGFAERSSAVPVQPGKPSLLEVAPSPTPPPHASVDELAHPASVLLRPEDAGQRLALSRARIYELMATGELESVTIGRSRRVPLTAIIDFIRSKRS